MKHQIVNLVRRIVGYKQLESKLDSLYSLQVELFNAAMQRDKDVYIPSYDIPPKKMRMERTDQGELCFRKPSGTAREHSILVVSVPKSGTYLIAKLLKELGYGDAGVHVANGAVNDQREYKNETFLYSGESQRFSFSLNLQMQLIKKGQFAVGHIGFENKNILADKLKILSCRDLRATFVSHMRYWQKMDRNKEKWASMPYSEEALYEYTKSKTAKYIIAQVESFLKWVKVYPNNYIRFEEIALQDLHGELMSIRNLSEMLNLEVDEIMRALEAVRGQQTLTFMGKHTSVDIWSERVENVFKSLGGDTLNEQLGYNLKWYE